jgi:ubiquinone/menaquinone biosynthesis C-methylase UbiE
MSTAATGATMSDWRASLARRLILASQGMRFRGQGGYSSGAFASRGDQRPFPQAERESSAFRDFFSLFPSTDVEAALEGRDVLDFGSGYGGRTVDYARICRARTVIGVEPFEVPVKLSRDYAASLGIRNVDFRLCTQTTIPLPDASIDVVVSYDVLEHVASPPHAVREIHRVLRPGGKAFLVFPVYFGAASHHLDYVSGLPGLHWLFSARTLVRAVNSILTEEPRFGTNQQPAPQLSFDGRREVLPLLNGLSGWHLPELFAAFHVDTIRRHALLRRRPIARSITAFLTGPPAPLILRDALTSSIACVLVKHAPA